VATCSNDAVKLCCDVARGSTLALANAKLTVRSVTSDLRASRVFAGLAGCGVAVMSTLTLQAVEELGDAVSLSLSTHFIARFAKVVVLLTWRHVLLTKRF
jgi:hypothetical protein